LDNNIYNQFLLPKDFQRLSGLIEAQIGIKMPLEKKQLIESRIRKRLIALGFGTFHQYCDYLFTIQGQERELPQMINEITTHKTEFFRESDHFEFLMQTVLLHMALKEGGGTKRKLMVWSAGCSTGEEAYTLAIVLSEFRLKLPGLSFQFEILGTDISPQVLTTAQEAIYPADAVEPIPIALRHKYLMRHKNRRKKIVRIKPGVREHVSFRKMNLLNDDIATREPIDIIFCRNVIIYFDKSTQRMVIQKILDCLRPGGYLFLGHSESLHGLGFPVEQVAPTVYKKLEVGDED
jgi:chemotaxis protein methyltransferase CheR